MPVIECYVCTRPAELRQHAIPFCASCVPGVPVVKVEAAEPPAPRPTPRVYRAQDCVVLPGGFCNGTCPLHGCTPDFCTC